MMNPVHARRDKDHVQNPLQLYRQPPVGMMKESRSFKCDKEHNQHYRCDAKERHRKRKKANGKNHFAEMESGGSAHIEVKIGVMHVMKTAEDRNHVIGPMPPPVVVVHQKECCDDNRPGRKVQPI